MSVRAVLGALRRGDRPDPTWLAGFARGLADGRVSDAQAGAFAMGVCRSGLGDAGRVALTAAMRDSGAVLQWDLPGPVLDKHSTGGVGDCVSLVLAPALAALGAYVPMVSGRGLGHTGGTLDKLEAIPGVVVDVPMERFRAIVADTGCGIVAASDTLAPADRRLYAIRDVTGTVDHVDLITASILSKKLAAGIGTLVLDVKLGSGAFMRTPADADALARALIGAANGAGCRCDALVTDMAQPLAPAIGNAVEVAAAMRVLTGADPQGALASLSGRLGGVLLAGAGLADNAEAGAARVAGVLASGMAVERFAAMVAALGGPSDFAAHWQDALPAAPVVVAVPSPGAGHVAAIDGTALGEAVVRLGGGRLRGGDAVDPRVGLTGIARLGAAVAQGDPLALVHAADDDAAQRAVRDVSAAITVGPAPAPRPLVHLHLRPGAAT